MTETESVADYSSRLRGIAQESVVLGKRYKDKKLVKKFLRSLPDKFQPHMSAIDVSLNSDELKYNKVVGMMQAFEMQLKKKEKMNAKSFALKAAEEQKLVESQELEHEEKVGLLVKKYFCKMERGQRKGTPSLASADSAKGFRKNEKSERQCAECEGYGHYKAECPNNKRKHSLQCYGCKGFGHTKTDCPSQGNNQKSYITWSESDSHEEDNKSEILNNFVALLGVIEEDEEDEVMLLQKDIDKKIESDSDGEEAGLSMEDQISFLIQPIVQKTQDNSELFAERNTLQMNIAMFSKELSEEKAKSLRLEKQLEEQLKSIRMLSKGTKDLDFLLSTGQSSTAKWGLGYQGINSDKSTQFVKAQNSEPKLKAQPVAPNGFHNQVPKVTLHPRQMFMQCEMPGRQLYGPQSYPHAAQRPVGLSRRKGCWYCGHLNHYKAQCLKFQNRVTNLVQNGSFYPTVRRVREGFVRKDDLYCHVAHAANRTEVEQATWSFDSGCSRHMTGALKNWSHIEDVAAGRVTFGDGGKGTIRGKGATSGDTQPQMNDVFLVDGLKANLISVSQLCDEGLDVTFTKKDCKAVDQQGSVKLRGKRSGNNC
ncbi:PREDICTED: uncharacterized protein LOC104728727 [Camelina sativa]|uniref:Uncharacterized protein LOC104728727 n=1 Tax=Camelina sativa TaxID=90675 RepID=A0ABM0UT95_CAMSA|nr:PREDICTED: uncharacterized protein LOC104728727 [Camelina sativa]